MGTLLGVVVTFAIGCVLFAPDWPVTWIAAFVAVAGTVFSGNGGKK